jgi:hypothetical protein
VCLTYCVLWNTRNARLAKKSRAVSRPAAGRRVKPVCSEKGNTTVSHAIDVFLLCNNLLSNREDAFTRWALNSLGAVSLVCLYADCVQCHVKKK